MPAGGTSWEKWSASVGRPMYAHVQCPAAAAHSSQSCPLHTATALTQTKSTPCLPSRPSTLPLLCTPLVKRWLLTHPLGGCTHLAPAVVQCALRHVGHVLACATQGRQRVRAVRLQEGSAHAEACGWGEGGWGRGGCRCASWHAGGMSGCRQVWGLGQHGQRVHEVSRGGHPHLPAHCAAPTVI